MSENICFFLYIVFIIIFAAQFFSLIVGSIAKLGEFIISLIGKENNKKKIKKRKKAKKK